MSPQLLSRVAARFSQRPAFVGWALAAYAESEDVPTDEVRRRLGGTAADVDRLCLCLRPQDEDFASAVRQIADYAGVDADVLTEVLRRADVLDRMAAGPRGASLPQDAGTLLAARAKPRPPRKPEGDA